MVSRPVIKGEMQAFECRSRQQMRALSTDCALIKDEARIDILVTLNSVLHLDEQGKVKKLTTRVLTQLDRHGGDWPTIPSTQAAARSPFDKGGTRSIYVFGFTFELEMQCTFWPSSDRRLKHRSRA
jgi:hypothetical protein